MCHDGGAVIVFKNESESSTLEEELTLEMTKLMVYGQDNQKCVKVKLGPGSQKAVFFYIKSNDEYSLSTKSMFEIK